MTTITETLVELADRHTSLYHFSEPQNAAPLPLSNPLEYCDLHRSLANARGVEYSAVQRAGPANIINKLFPGYRNHKYWNRQLRSRNYKSYPDLAWQNLLPIQANLTIRIECTALDKSLTVQPVPRVLLYPFGWSTWISLRLIGSFEIASLSSFLAYLMNGRAFKFSDGSALNLTELFERVAEGVRSDGFGGNRTMDVESSNTVIVTTVTAKHGGSPALGALNQEDQKMMLGLVRPSGARSGRPFTDHVFQFGASEFEYLVLDDVSRFNWIEHLLIPRDRNHQLLNCYHHNSFLSLLQADHFHGLVGEASKQKAPSQKLYDLAQTALGYLQSPTFKNASLHAYLTRDDIKQEIEEFSTILAGKSPKPPGG